MGPGFEPQRAHHNYKESITYSRTLNFRGYTGGSPGYFNLTNIFPNQRYDLMLVDEDGDICELHNLQFFGNQTFYLTQTWLLGCEGSTKGL